MNWMNTQTKLLHTPIISDSPAQCEVYPTMIKGEINMTRRRARSRIIQNNCTSIL
jgi:hypothetical protein